MRILLIGNFAPDRQESMLRFARLLADGFRERGHEVETWSPEPAVTRCLPNYRYDGAAKYLGYFDKFFVFPRQVRSRLAHAAAAGRSPDFVHIVDHANAGYSPLFRDLPVTVTCHDLLQVRTALGEFPGRGLPERARRYQRWILGQIQRVPLTICVSEKTRADLQRIARVPDHRVRVIHNGLNHPYRPVPPAVARATTGTLLRERALPADALEAGGRGFILHVGGNQWYKNRRGLLDLYDHLRTRLAPPPRLVLAGKPPAPDLIAHARTLGLGEELISLPGVSETQLEALYTLADALVFPSWEEGFGWPVAEAQACGCPVFTSNRAPMTEVGGEAAGYFDPADPAAAAGQIAASWPLRRALAARGLARASRWDPQAMITRYLETYETASTTVTRGIFA